MPDTPRIATVSLNPAVDQTALVPNFAAGAVNRVEREQSDAGGKGVNVASFLAHFGVPVAVTGMLGDANIEHFVRCGRRAPGAPASWDCSRQPPPPDGRRSA